MTEDKTLDPEGEVTPESDPPTGGSGGGPTTTSESDPPTGGSGGGPTTTNETPPE